jgi:hypothetical protein
MDLPDDGWDGRLSQSPASWPSYLNESWLFEEEQEQEHGQHRNDAEHFRERKANEEKRALAIRRRRIAQRARQELSEDASNTDRRGAHANTGKASSKISRSGGIHELLLILFGSEKAAWRGFVNGGGEGRR